MGCAVVFGGAGFVGVFFAKALSNEGVEKIYLYDRDFGALQNSYRHSLVSSILDIEMITGDVRESISWVPPEKVELIANFAAVHREPGHEDYEYYTTNILGAENVCEWAEKVGCNNVVFTSSISPYGIAEEPKDETSMPVPISAYGGSKLAAEKIHQIWVNKDVEARRLVIVRPGVVFGPTEGGNVSRLIKAVLHRYFFYMGNHKTRKAGVYVKELCAAILWVRKWLDDSDNSFALFNMTMNPGPSIEEYVEMVEHISDRKIWVPSVPPIFLKLVSYFIELVAKPIGISHPFSPVRIAKLRRSNNIVPQFLINNNYPFQYTLESAFRDWKEEYTEEWK